MSGQKRVCLLRSRFVARRLVLNVPEHLEQADVYAGGPGVTMLESPIDNEPSEAVQVDVQTERVALAFAIADACPSAGRPAVAASPNHDVVFSSRPRPAAEHRTEVGQNNPSHPSPVGLHY